jgi:hypothetical protein
MMTIADVRKFAPENKIGKGSYSQTKSPASWELVHLDRNDRAERIERFIADHIERRSGYKATTTQQNCHWDITADLECGPVKIEVKSALRMKGNEKTYVLQNIKPHLFEYLFLVLITPEGVRMGWANSEEIAELCSWKTERASGYSITVNLDKWESGEYDDWLFDIEDFPYGS